MTEETRVVLLKPGDVLLIGGVEFGSAMEAADAIESLRDVLDVRVAVFADDIQIDKLTAEHLAALSRPSTDTKEEA